MNIKQIAVPTLVRMKPGAVDRLGIYAQRNRFQRIALIHSQDLMPELLNRAGAALEKSGAEILQHLAVREASFEQAQAIFRDLSPQTDAVIGIGGGKALDVAKYVGFLSRLPYIAVPTSLSNDGFCSPQSSLTLEGKRKSLPSRMPFGVVIDTEVCLRAPIVLWWSGVGDLVAKLTAVRDWHLAFAAKGTLVDDLAALLSDATVFQFMARPERDLEGVALLGTALMLNGVAMEMCGSSRPASGSEHLISHALDATSARPRLHGLQVGIATYLMSRLQGQNSHMLEQLFDRTGFWKAIAQDPFSRREWLEAVRRAPSIKPNYYTVLSSRDCLPEVEQLLTHEERLRDLFVD